MRVFRNILISVLVIVGVLTIALVGVYFYARNTYGVDIFNTASQLKTLVKEVDEGKLCPNKFGAEDFAGLKNVVNAQIDGLITYQEGEGYGGYKMNYNALEGKTLSANVVLSEKQVGAFAQLAFYEKMGDKMTIGGKEVEVSLLQVDFSNVNKNGSADFNMVCKISLAPFKADMGKFPYKLFKKYIPDNLYVSSTVHVEKTDEGFAYNITSQGLALNNLSQADTEDLFHTLDVLLKIGSAKDLNLQIGSIGVNALIGNEQNVGFAYSLKSIGAKAFAFTSTTTGDTTTDYFVVK